MLRVLTGITSLMRFNEVIQHTIILEEIEKLFKPIKSTVDSKKLYTLGETTTHPGRKKKPQKTCFCGI